MVRAITAVIAKNRMNLFIMPTGKRYSSALELFLSINSVLRFARTKRPFSGNHSASRVKSVGQRLCPALQFLQKRLDERRQLPRPERGERHGGKPLQGDRADSGRQLGSGNGDRQTDAVAAVHEGLNQCQ